METPVSDNLLAFALSGLLDKQDNCFFGFLIRHQAYGCAGFSFEAHEEASGFAFQNLELCITSRAECDFFAFAKTPVVFQ